MFDESSGSSSDSDSEMVLLYNAKLGLRHETYLVNLALDALVYHCIES